jgi:geranylgeranyl pyrophosphate synthase
MTRHSAVPPPVTRVVDEAGTWLPRRLGAVEGLLREQVDGHGSALGADAESTLAAGGKRLRPLLVLLCAGEPGGEAAVRAGAAVELVHMASLVHDDVLDDAPLRRGRPTVSASSGRGRATATGDLLFSRAFALLARNGSGDAVELLSEASVALAQGELAQRRDAYDTSISAERYLERCRLKTARLFECACLIGRSTAGVSHTEPELRAFGSEVGLAFQLLDDVLDVSGTRDRPPRRHGHPLPDPRRGARSRLAGGGAPRSRAARRGGPL